MMTGDPLISIVTPSYNQGEFIKHTLNSVKNQTYENVEHIVMDGGSTDGTIEILRTYEEEYDLKWQSETDEGQSDALNKGFERAEGDIVGWLNADDVYLFTDVLEQIIAAFEDNSHADIIYGGMFTIDSENNILRCVPAMKWEYERMFHKDIVPCVSTFMRDYVVDTHKINLDFDYSMDYEYWLRLAQEYEFENIDLYVSGDRLHEDCKRLAGTEAHRKEDHIVQEQYRPAGYTRSVSAHINDRVEIIKAHLKGTRTHFQLGRTQRQFGFEASIPPLSERLNHQLNLREIPNLLRGAV